MKLGTGARTGLFPLPPAKLGRKRKACHPSPNLAAGGGEKRLSPLP